MIENKNTAATWIEEFAQKNHGMMWIDEYGKALRQMKEQTYQSEKIEYFLKIADNKAIERSTRAGTVRIEDPAMVMLGTTVDETFFEDLTPEQLLDGSAQRILFAFGKEDPSRPMRNYAVYETEEIEETEQLSRSWSKVTALPIHQSYPLTKEALDLHKEQFRIVCGESVPKSFIRRVMWRAFKYALIYHVLLGKSSAEIDREDMAYAHRIIRVHLYDLKKLLDRFNFSSTERIVRAAEALQERKGRRLTTRDLVAGIRAIQNVGQARAILELMREPKPDEDGTGQEEGRRRPRAKAA
jgi:hypothetical protein